MRVAGEWVDVSKGISALGVTVKTLEAERQADRTSIQMLMSFIEEEMQDSVSLSDVQELMRPMEDRLLGLDGGGSSPRPLAAADADRMAALERRMEELERGNLTLRESMTEQAQTQAQLVAQSLAAQNRDDAARDKELADSFGNLVQAFDKDNDGQLNKEEFAALYPIAMFEAIDKDQSGFVTLEELSAAIQPDLPRRLGLLNADLTARMEKVEEELVTSAGAVSAKLAASQAEFAKAKEAMDEKLKAKEQQEKESQLAQFAVMDADGDGNISLEEFERSYPKALFQAMDRDHSGSISAEEFSQVILLVQHDDRYARPPTPVTAALLATARYGTER
jgi:Ca2+-binding EF-hand superfamily protein